MLRIGKMTDYGIVLLSHFAKAMETSAFNARELSESAKLPLPTVSKILKVLSRAELLVSHRGVSGGYRLARPAKAISIAEIISTLEGPIAVTECCTHEDSLCGMESVCPTRTHWLKINVVVRKALEDLTLADMVSTSRRPEKFSLVTGKTT